MRQSEVLTFRLAILPSGLVRSHLAALSNGWSRQACPESSGVLDPRVVLARSILKPTYTNEEKPTATGKLSRRLRMGWLGSPPGFLGSPPSLSRAPHLIRPGAVTTRLRKM